METVPHTFRSELSAGTIVGGDFEVERRLAAGGMGEVYLVKQRSTGHARGPAWPTPYCVNVRQEYAEP
jgi:hypothetical protein